VDGSGTCLTEVISQPLFGNLLFTDVPHEALDIMQGPLVHSSLLTPLYKVSGRIHQTVFCGYHELVS
jgi:hypothetical protein